MKGKEGRVGIGVIGFFFVLLLILVFRLKEQTATGTRGVSE